jgi:hypothetical protein
VVSKHRYLNRPAIGEQHHRLVARLREMAAEFPQQLRLVFKIFDVRRGFMGMPSASFWSSRSNRTANAALPK